MKLLTRNQRRTVLWMMGPAVLFTVLLIGFPFVYTLWISLHNWFMGAAGSIPFVGLANYVAMLHDHLFWQSVGITFEIAVVSLIVEMVLGTYIAMLLHREGRMIKWLRTVVMLPSVTPSVAAGMVWLVLLDPSLGFVNFLMKSVGVGPFLWVDAPSTVVPTLIMIDVWQWTPFIALVVLGGLQALPLDPYEAARIDGASDFQVFRYLTLPLLTPVLWVGVMLRSVDVLRIFDTIYVMTQGGPGTSSTSLNIYAYQQGFEYFHMGYASTLMITLLLLVVIFNVGLAQLRRRRAA